jgi:hypothetical protein
MTARCHPGACMHDMHYLMYGCILVKGRHYSRRAHAGGLSANAALRKTFEVRAALCHGNGVASCRLENLMSSKHDRVIP